MRPWSAPPAPGVALNQALGAHYVYLPGTADDALLTAGSGGAGSLTNTDGVLRRSFSSHQQAKYRTAREHERVGAGAILWAGNLLGTPTTAACLGGLTYAATNISPYAALQLKRRSVSSNNLILTHSVGGSSQQIVSTQLVSSGPVVLVGSAAGGAQALWVLDVATGVVSVVRGTVAGSVTSVAGALVEVGDSLNNRNPMAACELMALFNRPLADAEALMLLSNPYAVFTPGANWVPFGQTVAGGSQSADMTSGMSAGESLAASAATLAALSAASSAGEALVGAAGSQGTQTAGLAAGATQAAAATTLGTVTFGTTTTATWSALAGAFAELGDGTEQSMLASTSPIESADMSAGASLGAGFAAVAAALASVSTPLTATDVMAAVAAAVAQLTAGAELRATWTAQTELTTDGVALYATVSVVPALQADAYVGPALTATVEVTPALRGRITLH